MKKITTNSVLETLDSFGKDLDKSLERGKGKFRTLTCEDIHDLISWVNGFDSATDDNWKWKDVLNEYENLSTHVRDCIPIKIFNYMSYESLKEKLIK